MRKVHFLIAVGAPLLGLSMPAGAQSIAAPATSSGHPIDAAIPDSSGSALIKLSQLVGTWKKGDEAKSALRIQFSLTAGGTVLAETWLRGNEPHSLTVYHKDGQGLIATHYCPQGNQPRLGLVPATANDVVQFAFRDATDLDEGAEGYLVALSFELVNDSTIIRRETYRQGSSDEISELKLVRAD